MGTVITVTAALLATASAALPADESTGGLGQCQAAYQEIQQLRESDIQIQIEWWQSQEPICAGTGLYEYFLGKLYLRAKQYGLATQAFDAGARLDSEYQKELELALGDVQSGQQRYEKAEEIYRRVAQRYPDWSQGHHSVGLVLWIQGSLKEAIASLNRAVELNETAESYRILTMAYYSSGEYARSTEALNYAYSLDNAIAGDRDPMIAGIRSYTELGKYEIAKNLLAMLLHAHPSMREDEEFLKAGFYLREKMLADAGKE